MSSTTPQEYHEDRLQTLMITHAHYAKGPPSMAKHYDIKLVDLTMSFLPAPAFVPLVLSTRL